MESETRRDIILENNAHPFNRKTIDDKDYIKVNANNSSCIDNINLFIKFKDDKIEDAYFDGEACAISTSATSILLKNIIGFSIKDIETYINNYENMINDLEYQKDLMKEALAFEEIYKQQNRKTCALIPVIALKKALENYRNSLEEPKSVNLK